MRFQRVAAPVHADRSFIKLNIYTDYHECFELINDIFYKVQVNEL